MVWPLVIAAAGTAALSMYSNSQQAKAAKEQAKARAMSNLQYMKNIRTEAQGRRLINLENFYRANQALTAGSAARGVDVGSASNLAAMRGSAAKLQLDNLSINANMEQRISNLVTDTSAAYSQAALVTKQAGINSLKSLVSAGATVAGGMGGAGGATQGGGGFVGAGSLTPQTSTWTGGNSSMRLFSDG